MIEGWEISPDRVEMLEKILDTDPVGDPVITSKCRLSDKKTNIENGLLVASNDGFAWRIKMGYSSSLMSAGKSKWVRWHDVAGFIPKKPGFLILELKSRKKGGPVIVDKKGNYKVKKWRFFLDKNKGEEKAHYKERVKVFDQIMMDLWNKNKGDSDPPTSDSRI
jgi:hypothetical protein